MFDSQVHRSVREREPTHDIHLYQIYRGRNVDGLYSNGKPDICPPDYQTMPSPIKHLVVGGTWRQRAGAGLDGGTLVRSAEAADERHSTAIVFTADGATRADCRFRAVPEREGALPEAAPQHLDERRAEGRLAGA